MIEEIALSHDVPTSHKDARVDLEPVDRFQKPIKSFKIALQVRVINIMSTPIVSKGHGLQNVKFQPGHLIRWILA